MLHFLAFSEKKIKLCKTFSLSIDKIKIIIRNYKKNKETIIILFGKSKLKKINK